MSLVEFLIDNGINPNIKDKKGNTPLNNSAFFDSNYNTARYLISNGGVVDLPNDFGISPLYRSANAPKMTQLLCENNHDINIVYKNNGNTPLHEAVRRFNIDVVKILLTYGAKINIKNNDGETPKKYFKRLHSKKKDRFKEMLSLL